MTDDGMGGLRKAAMLLVALGPDASAEVIRHFPEHDIERLTSEIFRVRQVPEDVLGQVIQEGRELTRASSLLKEGGSEYARAMLAGAIGEQKAEQLIERLEAAAQPSPFDFIRGIDTEQLIGFLQTEHPQTIALLLSHLPPLQAAGILSKFDDDLQTDVAYRVASMERTAPEVILQIGDVLRKKLALVMSRGTSAVGGIDFLVKVLSSIDRSSEKAILENLDRENPELAVQVRNLMFVFESIGQLDDRSLQRVLRDVDTKDLALALRGASEDLKEKFFKNISSRASEMLKEEMEAGGPVRMRAVEEAQQRIVAIVRRLDEAEEIVIERGNDYVV